jgi:hypothetical protein
MRATLSCKDDGWDFKLLQYLEERREVDLEDFDLLAHSKFCDDAARKFEMLTHYDPTFKKMRFFKLD